LALPVPDTAATPDILQAAVSGGFELCFHVIAPLLNWSFPTTLNPQSSSGEIVVRGARLHNLKNLTLSIPHNKITVITGVSGSGKSSLAFDTIYAEGQRRYIESLSAYARQFLERMEKPEVDEIEGIAPGIAIRQKNTTRNPRSTVATSTEIYDFMRLLWARSGRTFCPVCGRRVQRTRSITSRRP
jgi:excinuclease ABC subunit A